MRLSAPSRPFAERRRARQSEHRPSLTTRHRADDPHKGPGVGVSGVRYLLIWQISDVVLKAAEVMKQSRVGAKHLKGSLELKRARARLLAALADNISAIRAVAQDADDATFVVGLSSLSL